MVRKPPPDPMRWRARIPDPRDLFDEGEVPDAHTVPWPQVINRAIHDGDTLRLVVDNGNYYRHLMVCRLSAVLAPEVAPVMQVGGLETRQFVVDWITRHDNQTHWPFQVDTILDSKAHDVLTLGRFVCVVYSADRTACLNSEVQAFITTNGFPGGTGS